MKKLFLASFLLLGMFGFANFVFGITGTTGSVDKYAWSNKIGWINFGCSGCNVQITNSTITGYAWNENYGWINLSPSRGGVVHTSSGLLSGYAWGENTGWINFSGASINTLGQFTGTAVGDIVATINFACGSSDCPVTTDWRPENITAVSSGGSNSSYSQSTMPTIPAPIPVENTSIDSAKLIVQLQEQIQALIQQVAQLKAQLQKPATVGLRTGSCEGIAFTRNLKIGSTGADVKCLQSILNRDTSTQVAATGPGSPGNEITVFGSKTLAAVKIYQAANGLTPTIQVGPLTRILLEMDLSSAGDQTDE